MSFSNCKHCKAPIKWIRSAKVQPNGTRKNIPCDPTIHIVDTAGYGGRETVVTMDGRVVSGTPTNERSQTTEIGYESHYATCPGAQKFRSQNQKKNHEREERRRAKMEAEEERRRRQLMLFG